MKKLNFKIRVLTEKGTTTELNATGITGLIESIDFKKVVENIFNQKDEIQKGKRLEPYVQWVNKEKFQSFEKQIKNKQSTDISNGIMIFDGNNLMTVIKCLE